MSKNIAQNTPKNVLIVGSPRSGTSMAANVFASKGYFVAKEKTQELRPGDEHNPNGYWEAQSLIDCNVELFKAAGYPWHNSWLFDPLTSNIADQLAELPVSNVHKQLIEHYEQSRPWLWKDPRLCYTLGYWWPLLKHTQCVVVLIRRDPTSIYNSFVRLGWRSHSNDDERDARERIRHHLRYAEHWINSLNIPCIEVSYEDFRTQPEQIAHQLGEFAQLSLTSEDLKFNSDMNHSGLLSRLQTRIASSKRHLPQPLRTLGQKAKRLLRGK